MACIDCIPTCGFTLPYLLLQVRYLKKIKGNKISAEKSERLGWDKNYTLVPYGKKTVISLNNYLLYHCSLSLCCSIVEKCSCSTQKNTANDQQKLSLKVLISCIVILKAIFWSVVALNSVALHCSVSGHSGSSSVQTKPSNLSKTPFKMIQYHYLKYILKPQLWVNTQTTKVQLSHKLLNKVVFIAVLLSCITLHHTGVFVCYFSAHSVYKQGDGVISM